MPKQFPINHRDALNEKINRLQNKIAQLPSEDIFCAKNGKYVKWYLHNGSHPLYVPKKKQTYIENLVIKKFFQLQVNELKQEYRLVTQYLEYIEKIPSHESYLLAEQDGYKDFIQRYCSTWNDNIQNWIAADYVHNLSHPENLIHKTYSGIYVRSKSEVIIANALFLNKIPFRYECGLSLSDVIFYPDFTILHPQTGQLFYWEHFGMMDVASYRDSAFSKLKFYGDHNIILSLNLIATVETRTSPIDSYQIEQLIQHTFL